MVDNEQTGKLLLQKGQLKRRVTIIPLNKISHNVIDSGRMKKARDVAKSQRGNVSLHSCRATTPHDSQSLMICHPSFINLRPFRLINVFYLQVNMALELVGFDEEVRAAIEHVFGSALVTDSLQLAKVHPDTYSIPPPVPVLRFVDIY